MLRMRLIKTFPFYYLKHRKTLLTLFIAITLSIVVRTVFFTIFSFESITKEIYEQGKNDTALFIT